MSKGGQQQQQTMEFGSTGRGGTGFINKRSTIINRTSSGMPARNTMRSSYSGFGGLNLAPGTYSSMSHEGVINMKGKREGEKKEMQSLNERFGSYIEKVRFLETTIIQMEQELDYYRNQKAADFKPIRDMYENELAQARRVIDDLSAEKGGYDAKLAGLQDLVDSLRLQLETAESHNNDYRLKIDNQAAQIGGYEGELGTLRLRIDNLEDDNNKLRQINNQKRDENANLRMDLDSETSAHIEADCRAATLEEEVEFLRAILDKMPKDTDKPVKIKGLDVEAFWKDSMSKAIRDIQNEYDSKLDIIRQDMEARNASQLRQLQSGAVRDNMESVHAKEESKKLKSQLNGTGSKLAELEARLASMESERNELRRKLNESEMELEEQNRAHQESYAKLQADLEGVLQELKIILDAKHSLELEICCYRQLLEGEENRLGLKQIVEQAIGIQTKGAGQLSDIVQQSSLSESTGKLTVSRSSRGQIGFAEATHDGKFVSVENTGKGANAKAHNMTGWQIVRLMSGQKDSLVYTFLEGEELRPGRVLKIYAKGATAGVSIKNEAGATGERSCEHFSWGSGSGVTKLLDPNGVEKAVLKATFKQ